ncbi:Selenium-binding protein 2, partial [Pseudolycoriella hygida]
MFIGLKTLVVITLILASATDGISFRSVLYVWTGQDPSVRDASDFVAVVDFNERSPTYGSIIRRVPLVSDPSNGIGQAKNEPHHSSISLNRRYYVTGGLLSFLSKQKEILTHIRPKKN